MWQKARKRCSQKCHLKKALECWTENTAHPDISVKTDWWCCLPDLSLKQSRSVKNSDDRDKGREEKHTQKMSIIFSKDLPKSPKNVVTNAHSPRPKRTLLQIFWYSNSQGGKKRSSHI